MKSVLLYIFLFISQTIQAQKENLFIDNGNIYYRQSKFELAEAQYRQALKINSQSIIAKNNLANALMKQKKHKDAIALYDEITYSAVKNEKAIAYYNAGVGYTKQKDLESSIEAYKNALRNNPDDRQARENLQKALSELKKNQSENKNSGGGGSNMDPKDADNKLKQLEQKEKEAHKRIQKNNKGTGISSKDW